MSRPTQLTINLNALQFNLSRVREFAPGRAVMAMVKANAYGHGIVQVAKALSHAEALGVASLEEGIKLRESGITQPIVLIEGLFHADELQAAALHRFTLVVHHQMHLEMLEAAKGIEPFPVWLKINTGMHRLGIDPALIDLFYQRLLAAPAVIKPIGLMTHFAEADFLNGNATHQQMELFQTVTQHFTGPRSLANSAGIMAWPDAHGDWVRPGLMLYGASPFPHQTGKDHGLLPVMTFSSRLIAVNQVKKGGKVGYGGTWTAPEDMFIGVVSAGYGDGYPQFAQNGTPVLVNGTCCPLVGRVSMDMLTVDLRHASDAKVGDPVILWGEGLPVEHVAKHCGTLPYELLTRMTPRPSVKVIG